MKDNDAAQEMGATTTSNDGSSSSTDPPVVSTSPRTSTAAGQQRRKQQSPCSPCVQLLQDALQRTDSKPAALLRNMMQEAVLQYRREHGGSSSNAVAVADRPSSSVVATSVGLQPVNWRPTGTGAQVQIPVVGGDAPPPQQQPRRWSRVMLQHEKNTSTDPHHHAAASSVVQAVSSSHHGGRPSPSSSTGVAVGWPLASSRSSSSAAAIADDDGGPKTEWISLDCKQCSNTGTEANARAFVMGPTPLSIVVCQNRLVHMMKEQNSSSPTRFLPFQKKHVTVPSTTTATTTTAAAPPFSTQQRAEMDEILTHELIHVHDVRQLQLDLRDCHALAYSEIRAAREAECALAGQQKGGGGGTTAAAYAAAASCVRQKAAVATHNLFPTTGQACIDAVFDKAYADHRPFAAPTEKNNNGHNSR